MDGPATDLPSLTKWQPGPLVVVWFALLLRCMVSLWPYSGQGERPMYGDYEAQRHWMEITNALPLHQWYRFDLEYWGLDYPPLTAYVSWACGQLSRVVEPASMALGLSRGYETQSHKAFMRMTVLLLDLAIFFPAAAALTSRLAIDRTVRRGRGVPLLEHWDHPAATRALCMVLLSPSLVLVDHGHFQYNCVCLGLAVAAAAAVASGKRGGELVGSALFSLSLNFKQMALYYAPAFFFYLLASCVWSNPAGTKAIGSHADGTATSLNRLSGVLRRVLGLGSVVIITFMVLWAPFCLLRDDDSEDGSDAQSGCLSAMGQVSVRLFPFSRGLFEDKVANLWFCLDVVFKLRRRLPVPQLAKLALASTLSLLVPVGAELLRPGRSPTARRLVLALFNSSMAFFLCSFQVHEKSLLLPLCPLAFLWRDAPLFTTWLQVIGVFSMKPLLAREGLLVPCVVCTLLYVAASVVSHTHRPSPITHHPSLTTHPL
ncbi:Dolichyl pyrophosphate Man9GlcNAc2 alpha-1,3-glucosyltransferase, family GT57 [Ectocarpus siliculosus]|uniref:Alpha-1,3-glucosyltransferase n=1 Tax=Ectocarpus siliculosus TaxID=2880 RepID=D7G191_ECTSI|nr:Dolichyl pyrophosphate Man9GlcNAc2 alpha-1,3-glucosyltransferase, family GT57 [Ectocarpus siliculosus]|eukprot:CBJ33201.1 Dolichyl pyrophosphate Man9GlcNAc2 alpha-1,3-glucosyltransferase, family GT57 [Ectocarpus siliculosus]